MIDDLRTFITVINEASLTRAAEVLCVSQSTISKRIQKLESVLGVELFDRISKPPRPTAIARRLYAQATPLLGAWTHLIDIAREDAEPSGTFRMGLSPALADVALLDAVATMRTRFPALDVKLKTEWGPALLRGTEVGQLDAALLMIPVGAKIPEQMTKRHIAALDVKVVQSADKPLVKRKTPIRSLANQGWILNPDGCGYRSALQGAMAMLGHPLKISVDTYGTDMQMRLVSAGFGLGLIPVDLLRVSPYRDKLAILDTSDFHLSLDVWLLFPHRTGNLRPVLDALSASLIQCFAAG